MENVIKPQSCDGCIKKDVCKILQCVEAMLSPPNFEEGKEPFKPTDIGKICASYRNASLWKSLTFE